MIVKNDGGTYDICPAGNHVARCISVIDQGTQTTEYMGEKKLQRKVLIGFELPNERKVFKEDDGPMPYYVSKKYTASLNEKSNLRHDLASWRGRDFTESELDGFDLKNILDKPCMVQVIHAEKSGKTYANISNITQLPKGTECPQRVNPLRYFSLDNFLMEEFNALSERMREIIKQSPEYKTVMSDGIPGIVEHGDDIPF